MFNKTTLPKIALIGVGLSGIAYADDYSIVEKIIYGQGDVTIDGSVQPRDLWMDAYLPVSEETTLQKLFL